MKQDTHGPRMRFPPRRADLRLSSVYNWLESSETVHCEAQLRCRIVGAVESGFGVEGKMIAVTGGEDAAFDQGHEKGGAFASRCHVLKEANQ